MNNLYSSSKNLLLNPKLGGTKSSTIAKNLVNQISLDMDYSEEFDSLQDFQKAFNENDWEYFLTPEDVTKFSKDLMKAEISKEHALQIRNELETLEAARIGDKRLWIQKGRTKEGLYADTPENRKLKRVGQPYKKGKGEDEPKGKKGKGAEDVGSFRTKFKGKEVNVKYKMEGDHVVVQSVIGKDGKQVEDIDEDGFESLESVAKNHSKSGDGKKTPYDDNDKKETIDRKKKTADKAKDSGGYDDLDSLPDVGERKKEKAENKQKEKAEKIRKEVADSQKEPHIVKMKQLALEIYDDLSPTFNLLAKILDDHKIGYGRNKMGYDGGYMDVIDMKGVAKTYIGGVISKESAEGNIKTLEELDLGEDNDNPLSIGTIQFMKNEDDWDSSVAAYYDPSKDEYVLENTPSDIKTFYSSKDFVNAFLDIAQGVYNDRKGKGGDSKVKKALSSFLGEEAEEYADILQKGRTKEGIYANNAKNRKLGRVGQRYKQGEGKKSGKGKKEEVFSSRYSHRLYEVYGEMLKEENLNPGLRLIMEKHQKGYESLSPEEKKKLEKFSKERDKRDALEAEETKKYGKRISKKKVGNKDVVVFENLIIDMALDPNKSYFEELDDSELKSFSERFGSKPDGPEALIGFDFELEGGNEARAILSSDGTVYYEDEENEFEMPFKKFKKLIEKEFGSGVSNVKKK